MVDSVRLDILKRLSAHLEGMESQETGITLLNRVYRGKLLFGAEMALPSVSILEAPRQDDGFPSGEFAIKRNENWALLIQGWVPDDMRNPTDPAYELCAAVEKRLSEIVAVNNQGDPVNPEAFRLGRLPDGRARIAGITWAPPVIRPPQQGVSDKAFFYLPLTLQIAVDVREPFVAAG